MNKFQKSTSILFIMVLSLLLHSNSAALANNESPVGTWRSIDDKTGKPTSLIEITLIDNMLQGKIIKLLNPNKHSSPSEFNPLCKKCKGERANQPITGMIILWGVIQDGDHWGKGKILDPKKGKNYKVKLSLTNNGQKLKVRGYIGTPALGRTQIWERVN